MEENKKNEKKIKSKKFSYFNKQKLCNDILEEYYNVKFISIKPNWLKNPETNCNLKLNSYNDELKIALEYRPEHRYNYPNIYNESKEKFDNQQKLDLLKKKLCLENNVTLIIVPYWIKDIKKYIIDKLNIDNIFVSKRQKLCNDILEEYYNKHFFSVRPNWLKNPETGYNLEIDCYNDELKLALEYNGEQHYEWPNFTKQTKQEFEEQNKEIY